MQLVRCNFCAFALFSLHPAMATATPDSVRRAKREREREGKTEASGSRARQEAGLVTLITTMDDDDDAMVHICL